MYSIESLSINFHTKNKSDYPGYEFLWIEIFPASFGATRPGGFSRRSFSGVQKRTRFFVDTYIWGRDLFYMLLQFFHEFFGFRNPFID